MKTQELSIEGMSCGHCVTSVRNQLAKLKDVHVEDVQIGKARVRYDERTTAVTDLARAIEDAGYKLVRD